jgi:nucleoside-diphosphate-sugar epimerase
MSVVALRVSSVYGPGRRTPCLIRALIDSIHGDAAPVEISHSPFSLRQLIHVDDCVEGVLLALDQPSSPQFAYNIASGPTIPESKLAMSVAELFDGVRYNEFDAPRYFDGHIGALNIDAAARDLGFSPRTVLREGLLTFRPLI